MPETAKKLLLVDDDEINSSIRTLILERNGYTVRRAANGLEAVELIRAEEFDAVILDYHMPGLDGGEVLRQAKQLKPGLPVIMLTSMPDLPSIAYDLASAWLLKISGPEELLDAVAQVIERPNAAHAYNRKPNSEMVKDYMARQDSSRGQRFNDLLEKSRKLVQKSNEILRIEERKRRG